MLVIIKVIMIAIVLIVLLIAALLFNKLKSNFDNNGFAPETADYIKPIVYQNVVTPAEADYIIKTSEQSFSESTIVGGFNTKVRKSKTTWLYNTDPKIASIISRICRLGDVEYENAEALQVVKYEPGGYYNEHHDACCDNDPKCTEFVQKSGQRMLTMLIYLNDDFTGGETEFPKLNLKIKAPKYGGIMFRPLEKNSNRCHPYALHKGTPINSGIKYVCNVWVREGKW